MKSSKYICTTLYVDSFIQFSTIGDAVGILYLILRTGQIQFTGTKVIYLVNDTVISNGLVFLV